MGRWFRDYYLRPFCGAIWSTPEDCIGAFPARSLLRFMRNHALLSAAGQHQWWTVSGGSAVYVERLSRALLARGVEIRRSTPVRQVRRESDGVTIDAAGDVPRCFDQVVLATHADVALSLLAAPTPEERASLGAIRFQDNRAVLHDDAHQMPRRRRCWASWVVRAGETGVTVANGDVAALAGEMLRLLGDETERRRLADNARALARDTFVSWEQRMDMEREIIEELAGRKRGGGDPRGGHQPAQTR
jgi:predicted NAD/FAD-binding protein